MFQRGDIVKRTALHAQYGGSIRHGIVRLANHPYIFLFSSVGPMTDAYEDGWVSPTRFRYSGEGQTGDQQMSLGNKALRDHAKNGKRVFLFRYIPDKKGWCEVVGEVRCAGYSLVRHVDADRRLRDMILFDLELLDDVTDAAHYPEASFTQLRTVADEASKSYDADAVAVGAAILGELLHMVPPGGVTPSQLEVTVMATSAVVQIGEASLHIVRSLDPGAVAVIRRDLANGRLVRVIPLDGDAAERIERGRHQIALDLDISVGPDLPGFLLNTLDWQTAYDRRRTRDLLGRLLDRVRPDALDVFPELRRVLDTLSVEA